MNQDNVNEQGLDKSDELDKAREMNQDNVNEQGLDKSSALGRLSANSTRPGEKVTQGKKNGQGLDKSPAAGSVDTTRTGQVELSSLELAELWTSNPDPPVLRT
eukprot:gene18385-biopygen18963